MVQLSYEVELFQLSRTAEIYTEDAFSVKIEY